MPTPITITIDSVVLKGELFDNPPGRALADILPFRVSLNRWGEEFYGNPDKTVGTFGEETQEVMEKGDLAYHDDTGWFCIFWGPTPSSQGTESRAAFPVQKVGTTDGDWDALSALSGARTAVVEAAS
jgi:hypothetical protein